MARTILVSADPSRLVDLEAALKEQGAATRWARSGREALETIMAAPVDLIVADDDLGDMDGLSLIHRVVVDNPSINCALVSALAPEAFHAASEGLGILMQLPPAPSATDAERLMERLGQITGRPTRAD